MFIGPRNDPSFTEGGAWAYQRDLPDAEIHLLEAGHFAMDTKCDEVALISMDFLDRKIAAAPDRIDGDRLQ